MVQINGSNLDKKASKVKTELSIEYCKHCWKLISIVLCIGLKKAACQSPLTAEFINQNHAYSYTMCSFAVKIVVHARLKFWCEQNNFSWPGKYIPRTREYTWFNMRYWADAKYISHPPSPSQHSRPVRRSFRRTHLPAAHVVEHEVELVTRLKTKVEAHQEGMVEVPQQYVTFWHDVLCLISEIDRSLSSHDFKDCTLFMRLL